MKSNLGKYKLGKTSVNVINLSLEATVTDIQ